MVRGSTPDPAHQFAQDHRTDSAKDDYRPRFPHQSVDQLVQLGVRHAEQSSNFAA
jgi:hypothetical protein